MKWIERKTSEKDVPELIWALQRTVWALMRCYPSGSYGENAEMILHHVRTVLGQHGG